MTFGIELSAIILAFPEHSLLHLSDFSVRDLTSPISASDVLEDCGTSADFMKKRIVDVACSPESNEPALLITRVEDDPDCAGNNCDSGVTYRLRKLTGTPQPSSGMDPPYVEVVASGQIDNEFMALNEGDYGNQYRMRALAFYKSTALNFTRYFAAYMKGATETRASIIALANMTFAELLL